MLVLTHPDGLWIDFHQFSERVLQSARNRHGASQRHVELRKLAAGEITRGVHRRARFAHHDHFRTFSIFWRIEFAQCCFRERFRFTTRGAVADGDELGREPCHQQSNRAGEAVFLMQVQCVGVYQCAGCAHDGDFHAGPKARVESDNALLARRRRQQKLLEVAPENRDRFVVGARFQFDAKFYFDGRRQHPLVRFRRDQCELVGRAARAGHLTGQACVDVFDGRLDAPQQFPFRLTAADGQHAMAGNSGQGFGVLEVVLELRVVLLLVGDHAAFYDALRACHFAHPPTNHRVLGDLFGQDIARALHRGVRARDFRRLAVHLGQYELAGPGQQRGIVKRAIPHQLRQRRESALPRDHGACATLGLERQIEVFERLLGVCGTNRRPERVVQLALVLDALENRGSAFFHLVEILAAIAHIPQLYLIQSAGDFLAIARDKGKRRAFGKERKRAAHLAWTDREFGRDARDECRSKRFGHRCGTYSRGVVNSRKTPHYQFSPVIFFGAPSFNIFTASSIAVLSSRSNFLSSSIGVFFTHTSGGTPRFSRFTP